MRRYSMKSDEYYYRVLLQTLLLNVHLLVDVLEHEAVLNEERRVEHAPVHRQLQHLLYAW